MQIQTDGKLQTASKQFYLLIVIDEHTRLVEMVKTVRLKEPCIIVGLFCFCIFLFITVLLNG